MSQAGGKGSVMADWRENKVEGLRSALMHLMSSTGGILFQNILHMEPGIRNAVPRNAGTKHIHQELWTMLSEGLVFIESRPGDPAHWQWILTDRGLAAASGDDRFEPNDPDRYLARLRKRVPALDDGVEFYLREALLAFASQCWTAAAVMAGVAAERAFDLVGAAFVVFLTGHERANFKTTFESERLSYSQKFDEFRKRVEPRKGTLDPAVADGLKLMLDSIAEIIRGARNEAGHPTGRRFESEYIRAILESLAYYLVKLMALRDHFLTTAQRRSRRRASTAP
jgi:hypothetical protein